MRLKLFLLSPLTSLYNLQLNIDDIKIEEQIKRVITTQLILLPSIIVLGVEIVALLSLGNFLFILFIMNKIGDLNKKTINKIKKMSVGGK